MRNAWDELFARERRLGEMIHELFEGKGKAISDVAFVPSSDIFARNGDLVIDLALPGIDPAKDVTVQLEDGELVVRGERRHTEEVKDEDYVRMESTYGSFERHLSVPEGTTEKDIKAEYRNGVLEIVIPSGAKPLAKPEPKAIPISVGTS